MDGKTARGASSPAKPALHMPEPLSTTRAATSSSDCKRRGYHGLGGGERRRGRLQLKCRANNRDKRQLAVHGQHAAGNTMQRILRRTRRINTNRNTDKLPTVKFTIWCLPLASASLPRATPPSPTVHASTHEASAPRPTHAQQIATTHHRTHAGLSRDQGVTDMLGRAKPRWGGGGGGVAV